MTVNETIQASSQFCANNAFMLQNSHQAYKITFLKNIKFFIKQRKMKVFRKFYAFSKKNCKAKQEGVAPSAPVLYVPGLN